MATVKLVNDRPQTLCGISGLLSYQVRVGGKAGKVFSSGDGTAYYYRHSAIGPTLSRNENAERGALADAAHGGNGERWLRWIGF